MRPALLALTATIAACGTLPTAQEAIERYVVLHEGRVNRSFGAASRDFIVGAERCERVIPILDAGQTTPPRWSAGDASGPAVVRGAGRVGAIRMIWFIEPTDGGRSARWALIGRPGLSTFDDLPTMAANFAAGRYLAECGMATLSRAAAERVESDRSSLRNTGACSPTTPC